MTVRIAINGFGRIGRNVLRAIYESRRSDIEVLAINDLGPVESNAHLLRYDSIHGPFPGTINVSGKNIDIGLGSIAVFDERDPEKLPWKDLQVDVALECTGIFTSRSAASKHISAGAKKVLISAPSNDADFTVVYGVNHQQISTEHKVISNASCTTNCLAPVVNVINKTIGIERAYMTTVHAYTLDQNILDSLHSDLRRARSAGNSMIPTSTGAARAVGLVLPELKGKIDGTAIRVPTSNVSMVDLKFVSSRQTEANEINEEILKASEAELKNVIGYNEEPLVSIDFNHNSYSSTFDATQTSVVDKTLCRILTWYDNEWGFSNRMGDVAALMGTV
ncbi:type I glyceraldehyde-3-phosphate dehydrogenase [Candidatus Poribacteria bacterium]|nr:type I glyceraldehyde-3-phosphate dehydrogenase [Candidatus Poribacteria bacterium]|tara:strand:+ start:2083 stop:3087 length:1005 start_codon:yes stop_codon:yes gene_type:complete